MWLVVQPGGRVGFTHDCRVQSPVWLLKGLLGKVVGREASKRRKCGRVSRISGKANTEPGLLRRQPRELFAQSLEMLFLLVESVREIC